MSKNFLADMEIGDLGEELWAGWLRAKGNECTISKASATGTSTTQPTMCTTKSRWT